MGKVTTLQHKVGDNPVESAAFVCQFLSFLPRALLSGTKCSEVLSGFWDDLPI